MDQGQVDVVTAGSEGAVHPRPQYRVMTLPAAAVAVLAVALFAWFASAWWADRAGPLPARPAPGPVKLVLLDGHESGGTPDQRQVTFTALLLNAGSEPVTVHTLLWGSQPVAQAKGESLPAQHWTFVDFPTTVPCPPAGSPQADPPRVTVRLIGPTGATLDSPLDVLNRSVWDQIGQADCTTSAGDGPGVDQDPKIRIDGARATFTITVTNSATVPYSVRPTLVADGFTSTSKPALATMPPNSSLTAVLTVHVDNCRLALTSTIGGFTLLGLDQYGAQDTVVRALERIALTHCGLAGPTP